jgi:hypothetical protein
MPKFFQSGDRNPPGYGRVPGVRLSEALGLVLVMGALAHAINGLNVIGSGRECVAMGGADTAFARDRSTRSPFIAHRIVNLQGEES